RVSRHAARRLLGPGRHFPRPQGTSSRPQRHRCPLRVAGHDGSRAAHRAPRRALGSRIRLRACGAHNLSGPVLSVYLGGMATPARRAPRPRPKRAGTTADPVTTEIILGAFETICYEMATHVSLTATTPILNQSNERNATIL